ncbi:MAG: thioredoxin domain-containing protein [Leucobacter sp.]|nr:thioredoxin domain-containing protein [Leucobacter sp.]
MVEQKLTKNERREQAREQARIAREAEKKREKRNRLFLQGGVLVGVLAILGIVALVLTQSAKPAGPGPENMASGGVTFTKDLEVVRGPALAEGAAREAIQVDRTKKPLDVTVFVDYMCPACGAFEAAYGEVLEPFVGSGDINLTINPINFLDSQSAGTKYSTRAANLMSCVVDEQPEGDHAFRLHNLLLSEAVQPDEGTSGLTDEQLLDQAEAAGVTVNNELKQCVKDRRFADFINGNTKQALEVGVLGLADGARLVRASQVALEGVSDDDLQPADEPQRLVSTPTVIVNGKQWYSTRDGNLQTYLLKVMSDLEGTNGDSGDGEASDG